MFSDPSRTGTLVTGILSAVAILWGLLGLVIGRVFDHSRIRGRFGLNLLILSGAALVCILGSLSTLYADAGGLTLLSSPAIHDLIIYVVFVSALVFSILVFLFYVGIALYFINEEPPQT